MRRHSFFKCPLHWVHYRMDTIVYLIRHSTKFEPKNIKVYNSTDNDQQKTEKKMLNVEGEERAKILSNQEEFEGTEVVYSSDYVRAMQTAKYFVEKYNIPLNIDKRFNERTKGNPDLNKYPDFFCKQYWEKTFKADDGESQVEVNKRMTEALWEVVNNNRNKKIAIFAHGTSISFLLMNWCKLLDVQPTMLRKFEFNNKIVIDRPFKAPEVFKLTINDNNEVIDIINLDFDDLP